MAENYKALKAQLDALQERTEAARIAELEAVVAQVRDLVAEYGITEDQIFGRKRAKQAANSAAVAEPKYQNPKTGETWSGRGRAPAWIANAKDRSKFLVDGASSSAAAGVKAPAKVAKARNQRKGPQPVLYRDPKSGATWSGRGRAPAWLASVKDRSKYLIAGESEVATAPKAKLVKPAAKKTAAKKVAETKKTVAKKAAARKIAPKESAAAKAPAARKARVPKSLADSAGAVDAGGVEGTTQVASVPAQA
ncbi:TPA: H-NS histone family protein [Burkholderia vietnamiensis]|uniref:H-NS family nucleoid-associated regulatory protein n=1 Tax=Burkholderia vietnamiensis TaxID=60552 RepID=UPI001BA15D8F|nr:H-NS family nucleoid-associated regulatory protein [Burkholderia vietnamiensis]MBR7914189.1 H-NS histone family protein [Burkholderia vietnamiensis]HDR9278463.1 H-NS histone family protein [Burkholderia vietnamiensis]